MKQLFLFFAILVSFNIQAAIRTVSNNPATLAQFSIIQAAIDASSNGDSVFVHGSPDNYAGFTILNKQLVIVGPDWSPDKNLPHVATINSAIILSGSGTTGTEIQGLTTTSTASVTIATLGINNIRFIRNHIVFHQISLRRPARVPFQVTCLRVIGFQMEKFRRTAALHFRILFFKTIYFS
ncbi:MAG: hypothetical protein IPL50_04475 [Chitinophagaceae bacterium]|nr:hypothetical protein [Chitinophagaceae bacterium]